MREALHALTLRGRAFVSGGLTVVLSGVLFGERDLVRIGVLVALLPLVTAVWVARSGNRLGLVRTLSSRQVECGQPVQVHLELTNVGPTTGVLLLEEQIPYALGSRPRFVIEAMGPGKHRRIEYPVRSEVRGRYAVGPLRVRVADPFGLIGLTRTFTTATPLVVTPKVVPLPPIQLRGVWTGSGDNRPRAFSSGGLADVTVRDYRIGDDLRRVHWRSSAHVGELMVRREEQPWQSRCTLLVDNRARSHRGEGAASSLETAVVASASIAVHLAALGYQVRLVSAAGEELDGAWHDGSMSVDPRPLLERLAMLPTVTGTELATDWVDETVTGGLFMAVLGAVDDFDRAFFSRIDSHGGAPYALVLDVGQWGPRSVAGVPATKWLQARGWKATTLERNMALSAAWQELGR